MRAWAIDIAKPKSDALHSVKLGKYLAVIFRSQLRDTIRRYRRYHAILMEGRLLFAKRCARRRADNPFSASSANIKRFIVFLEFCSKSGGGFQLKAERLYSYSDG